MINRFSRTTLMIVLTLILAIALGSYLRVSNISQNKLYPDAYQNLIVAENLISYHNVAGYLGKGGLLFPQYIAWTRLGYSILIIFVNWFINDISLSAQYVSLGLGILSIILSFILFKKIFHSIFSGLVGAFLLAFSFDHIVWGGFILTETTGVFIVLLMLISLFWTLRQESRGADLKDMLTGILFGLCVITRYEYLLLTLPLVYIVLRESPRPLIKLANIFSTTAVITTFLFIQFFPVKSALYTFLMQIKNQFYLGIGIIVLAIFFILSYRKFKIEKIEVSIIYVFFVLVLLVYLRTIIYYIFKKDLGFSVMDMSGIEDFLISDFLLGITFILGSVALFRRKDLRPVLLFSLISIFVLTSSYYEVNPSMQRYLTHIIPFMLIPSSYIFIYLKNIKSRTLVSISVLCLLFLAVLQFKESLSGIKTWRTGEWMRISYEERSARVLKDIIPEGNFVLITSQPEVYYFFTGYTTQTISDTFPYIYFNEVSDSTPVYIVQDMGMNYYFPNFSKFLASNTEKDLVYRYSVGEVFHTEALSHNEKQDVLIYKSTLGDLKNKIQSATLL